MAKPHVGQSRWKALASALCLSVILAGLNGCKAPESRIAPPDPVIAKFGEPDEIMGGGLDAGESEPLFFANKGPLGRWRIYLYRFDGWILMITTKDGKVVRMTTDEIQAAEGRAQKHNLELKMKFGSDPASR